MPDTQRNRIPLPTGLVTSIPTDLLQPGDSPDLLNVRSKYLAITQGPGRAIVTAQITAEEVKGLFRSPQADGDEWILALLESTFWRFGDTAPATPRTWIEINPVSTAISSVTGLWSAITAEDKFFFTNGSGPIFVWPDGLDPVTGEYTPLSALVTSGTAPEGQFLDYYNNRLFVGRTVESGALRVYRIRWSESGDFRRWDDTLGLGAGFLDLYEGGQEPIKGMKVLGDRLVVYKPHSIIDIIKTGVLDPTHVTEVRVVGVGTSSPYTVASNGIAHFFLGTDAKVYVWNGVQAIVISNEIENRLKSAYNPFLVDNYYGVILTRPGEYWLILSDQVFVYDYINQRWFYDSYVAISSAAEVEDSQTVHTWQTIPGSWDQQTDTWESLRAERRTTTWTGGNNGVVVEVSESIIGDEFNIMKTYVDTGDIYLATDPREVGKLHRVAILYDYVDPATFRFLVSFDRGQTWQTHVITPNELGISLVDINASGHIVRFRLEGNTGSARFRWKFLDYEWQPEGPFIPSVP